MRRRAPGSQLTSLPYPNSPGNTTLFTIAHSTFGNQVVGNYDTRLVTGNAFLYDIPTGTFTNINKPGAVSTTAYGVYGNKIAGGYGENTGPGPVPIPTEHGYIYNQATTVFTRYDAPDSVLTHFEGITSGGRANTYNLVADSIGTDGKPHAWAVSVDALGVATWTEISVIPGGVTSANSTYGGTVIGVYVDGAVKAYTVYVPGLYNPVTNSANLTSGAPGAVAINGAGDDVINTGSIQMSGANAIGISNGTYGVVTNYGTIGVTGAGGTAVQMSGDFSTLLNTGTISAAPGGYAIQTDATAMGSVVVNNGIINGLVSIAAGPDARFENSGWLGIGAAGAGATHQISGTFVQTSAGTMGVRVSPTAADKLVVDGTARLDGGMQVIAQPGIFAPRSSHTVVTATGGLSGAYQSVVSTMPFLIPTLSYDANNVYLNLQVGGFFAGSSDTQSGGGRRGAGCHGTRRDRRLRHGRQCACRPLDAAGAGRDEFHQRPELFRLLELDGAGRPALPRQLRGAGGWWRQPGWLDPRRAGRGLRCRLRRQLARFVGGLGWCAGRSRHDQQRGQQQRRIDL